MNLRATLRRRLRALQPTEGTALLILAVALGLASGVCIWLFRRGVELTSHLLTDTLAHEVLGPVFGAGGIIVVTALGGLVVGWMMERFIGEERHKGCPVLSQQSPLRVAAAFLADAD